MFKLSYQRKISVLITGLLCGIYSIALAQEKNESTTESTGIKLAYHNSVLYPGARLGVELPFSRITVNRKKKSGKTKTIIKDRYLITQLSWYYHPRFHTNYYITTGGLLRRTKTSGFFLQYSLEAGYSRTFLAGTTYQVNKDGNVEKVRFAGNNYFALQTGGGLGYDCSLKKEKPIKIYLNFNVLILTPYNSSVYPRALIETGLVYKPKNFLSVKNRLRVKNKE